MNITSPHENAARIHQPAWSELAQATNAVGLYLNLKPLCTWTGPIRINGRLACPVSDIKASVTVNHKHIVEGADYVN